MKIEKFNPEDRRLLRFFLMIIFFVALLKSAWLSDDAQITLRIVLNFVHGYGPVFNIGERVQAYTHPLWFFILSGITFFSAFIYCNIFTLSILVALLGFWIFLRYIPISFSMGVIAALGLLLSKSYLDFSTSGLENPLAHLLLAGILLSAYHKKCRVSFFLMGLLYLTRIDLCLMILPLMCILLLAVQRGDRRYRRINFIVLIFLATVLPIAWTLFSLYYYGLPFPNTAYAKLHTGISWMDYASHGAFYLLDSLERDPITLDMITIGVVIGFFGNPVSKSLSLGILLYIFYIITIGGDFMSGRFLTAPLFLASILIARAPYTPSLASIVVSGLLFTGGIHLNTTLLAPIQHNVDFKRNIADERVFYTPDYALLATPTLLLVHYRWLESASVIPERRFLVWLCGGLGHVALVGGPSNYYLDTCALSDPLLSHLPQKHPHVWRIGHFERDIPAGYIASIVSNKNVLRDPSLHLLYDQIRLITRGPLNNPQRLRAILRLNFT